MTDTGCNITPRIFLCFYSKELLLLSHEESEGDGTCGACIGWKVELELLWGRQLGNNLGGLVGIIFMDIDSS